MIKMQDMKYVAFVLILFVSIIPLTAIDTQGEIVELWGANAFALVVPDDYTCDVNEKNIYEGTVGPAITEVFWNWGETPVYTYPIYDDFSGFDNSSHPHWTQYAPFQTVVQDTIIAYENATIRVIDGPRSGYNMLWRLTTGMSSNYGYSTEWYAIVPDDTISRTTDEDGKQWLWRVFYAWEDDENYILLEFAKSARSIAGSSEQDTWYSWEVDSLGWHRSLLGHSSASCSPNSYHAFNFWLRQGTETDYRVKAWIDDQPAYDGIIPSSNKAESYAIGQIHDTDPKYGISILGADLHLSRTWLIDGSLGWNVTESHTWDTPGTFTVTTTAYLHFTGVYSDTFDVTVLGTDGNGGVGDIPEDTPTDYTLWIIGAVGLIVVVVIYRYIKKDNNT